MGDKNLEAGGRKAMADREAVRERVRSGGELGKMKSDTRQAAAPKANAGGVAQGELGKMHGEAKLDGVQQVGSMGALPAKQAAMPAEHGLAGGAGGSDVSQSYGKAAHMHAMAAHSAAMDAHSKFMASPEHDAGAQGVKSPFAE